MGKVDQSMELISFFKCKKRVGEYLQNPVGAVVRGQHSACSELLSSAPCYCLCGSHPSHYRKLSLFQTLYMAWVNIPRVYSELVAWESPFNSHTFLQKERCCPYSKEMGAHPQRCDVTCPRRGSWFWRQNLCPVNSTGTMGSKGRINPKKDWLSASL